MRLVKLLFAVTIGLIVAAAVAIAGLFIFITHRFFGLFGRSRPTVGRSHRRPANPAAGDVIEVTATEVPVRTEKLSQ